MTLYRRRRIFRLHSLMAAISALWPALAGCSPADDGPVTSRSGVKSATATPAIPSRRASAASLPFLAPALTLPIIGSRLGASQNSSWNSLEAVGEYAQLVIVSGSQTAFDRDAVQRMATVKRMAAALVPAPQSGSGIKIIFISPDKSRPVGFGSSLPNAVLLWDEKQIVQQKFDLQNRFGIAPSQSVLLAIDRAGWLRRVEKIHSLDHVPELLKEIGDPTPLIEVGKSAPDFILSDMHGQPRRLRELKGKKHLLLTFFPRCFTGNCKAQLSSLNDAMEELQKNDVEVWAVSVDRAGGERGQIAYAKTLGLWFPLLPDAGRNLCLLYGAVNSPNQMATRMSVFVGKDGMVKWVDKQINPKTHGADVVAKMKG